MPTLYQSLLATVAGTVVIASGVVLNSDEILGEAERVANQANMHQLATVLEIYYLDHNEYPQVRGGEALIETLYQEEYIRTKPLDASLFAYEPTNTDNYRLSVRVGPLPQIAGGSISK